MALSLNAGVFFKLHNGAVQLLQGLRDPGNEGYRVIRRDVDITARLFHIMNFKVIGTHNVHA